MTLRTISAYAVAGFAALAVAAGAIAQDVPTTPDPALSTLSVEEMVEMRQAWMKENGGILRGAANLSGDNAVEAARKIAGHFTDFPALFPEGSITPDSKALPVIWENWDAFTGIFAKGREQAVIALAAAQAGDDAGFRAALQPIGQMCGECHQQFRQKD
jgi:cytochrome c556